MRIIYPLMISLLALSLYAQPPTEFTEQEITELELKADEYYQALQFHKAQVIYEQLDSIFPNTPEYMFGLAQCYLNQHYSEKALPYIDQCINTPEAYPNSLYFYAGWAYHLSHQFKKAISYYELYVFHLQKKKNKKNKDKLTVTEQQITMCKNGLEIMEHPLKVKVVNLGPDINSKYPDYGPVLSVDEEQLIFTSNRPNTTGGMIDPADGFYYEDIYISYFDDSTGTWSAPKGISDSINSVDHDASISLSPDGQRLLLFRTTKENIFSTSGNIYESVLEGKTWSKPVPLSQNINSSAWEPSASISANGKFLYFSSNRDGGKGGMDLYVSKRLPNGEWALPTNMGDKINTGMDEDSPFIHPDGKTLYFSSTGHKTMGGYDVFVSNLDESTGEWSTPENVGYPISTAHDDIHFVWSADGKRVYFSSIREGGYGDKDIYYAEIQEQEEEKTKDVLIVKGLILDSATFENTVIPVEATITITNSTTGEVIGNYNSNSNTGKYLLVVNEGEFYQIAIAADGYHDYVQKLDTRAMNAFNELYTDVWLKPNDDIIKELLKNQEVDVK